MLRAGGGVAVGQAGSGGKGAMGMLSRSTRRRPWPGARPDSSISGSRSGCSSSGGLRNNLGNGTLASATITANGSGASSRGHANQPPHRWPYGNARWGHAASFSSSSSSSPPSPPKPPSSSATAKATSTPPSSSAAEAAAGGSANPTSSSTSPSTSSTTKTSSPSATVESSANLARSAFIGATQNSNKGAIPVAPAGGGAHLSAASHYFGASLPNLVAESLGDIEAKIMARAHAHNKTRFRSVVLGSLLALVWVMSAFGGDIRRFFGEQAGEVAKETLRQESLQIQTQELATAVLQALLNDPQVIGSVTTFFRQAVGDKETQEALASLLVSVLQHPHTKAEVTSLVKLVTARLLADPDTLQQVIDMSLKALADSKTKAALGALVVELTNDEEVYAAVVQMANKVIADPAVYEQLNSTLTDSSYFVLNSPEVMQHGKDFSMRVLSDDGVQRTGGDAMWATVQYALQNRVMKAVGCTLVAASVLILGKSFRGP